MFLFYYKALKKSKVTSYKQIKSGSFSAKISNKATFLSTILKLSNHTL